jgi:hypothetical protein
MLSSAPASIGSTISEAVASGLASSLTIATVIAPDALAIMADSMMSALPPPCEIAMNS